METIILWLRHLASGRRALEHITIIPFRIPVDVARASQGEDALVSGAPSAHCESVKGSGMKEISWD